MMKIKKVLFYLYYYIKGNILAKRFYDVKYLSGRYFTSKYWNLTAPGWQWICTDAIMCKKMKVNLDSPWPCSARIHVVNPQNISFHPDDINNFQGFGNYFQAVGHISIGRGTYIAPNVGIITSNHDIDNLDDHLPPKPVFIGEKCWIGMNSTILPGVNLGSNTIVGAGSVVTKSFPEGHCVIAGNPAKKIRDLTVNTETASL